MTIDPVSPPKPRGRPTRSKAERDHMRHRISAAAGRLFQLDGFSNVSMRKIAKDVGVSPMTLYTYYDAKIDILRTLWGDVLGDLFDRLDAIPRGAGPLEYLRELCVAYVQYWIDNPDDYRLVFMAEGVMQPDVSLFIDTADIAGRYLIFANAITRLSGDALKHKLDFLLSALHGIAHNHITISGYDWSSPETQINYAIAGLGLKPNTAP